MIEAWDPAKHMQLVTRWHRERGYPKPEPWMFPKHGAVCDKIICAFLYLTDSGMAYIDNCVSDPDVKGKRTQAAELSAYLVSVAKELGVKLVMAGTSAPVLCEALKDNNFKTLYGNVTWLCKGIS